jgi:hypothetical protein
VPVLSKDVELGMWAASEAEGTDRGYSFQSTHWDREYPEEEEGNTETTQNRKLLKIYFSERNNSVVSNKSNYDQRKASKPRMKVAQR